ncbi:MAG: GNAT family N-acetyltransferase [Chloroflexi bacterium]|nr:GNAT family N-acetyltransferase [Chloroflexota bacterium]
MISPLHYRELSAVVALVDEANAALPYHWPLTPNGFREMVLLHDGAPHAILEINPDGWLVASEKGRVVGFIHCAVGRLRDDEPDKRRGFVRHLAIHQDAPDETAAALLQEAERFFRARGVSHIDVHHMRTGYPCRLAGRGALTTHDFRLMVALGEAGYDIRDRWLMYERRFHEHLIEFPPPIERLRLQIEDQVDAGFSFYAAQHTDPIAHLRIGYLPELSVHGQTPTASLEHLYVEQGFRRRGVGRWLLQRAGNELLARGYPRLVADINHRDEAAQALLIHMGFDELPLSGYSYGKHLV